MESVDTVDRYLDDAGYRAVSLSRTALGHLQTKGSINGQDAVLLIDTGASATIVARESAARLELAPTPTPDTAMGHAECGLSESAVESASVEELTFGTVRLQGIEAKVVDLAPLNGQLEEAGANRIDGILGADLLEEYGAIIGYAERRLYLRERPGGTC